MSTGLKMDPGKANMRMALCTRGEFIKMVFGKVYGLTIMKMDQ